MPVEIGQRTGENVLFFQVIDESIDGCLFFAPAARKGQDQKKAQNGQSADAGELCCLVGFQF